MLTLESCRGWSIYSLWGRRGTRASALYCAQTGRPNVGASGRMSGLWGSDVRAGEAGHVALGFGGVRISRQGAEYPGPREGPDVRACGAGCPGPVGTWWRSSCRGRRSRGRMSGAWEMLLAPSVGSPHPWTWGLVHLHVHLREGPLGA